MASGFINITDELCFAPRWSSYDNVLKIIVEHLDSNPLKLIFKAHYPHEDIAEDLDMGWGFIDEKNNTTVARNLNIYKLNTEHIDMFWDTVTLIINNLKNEEPSLLKDHNYFYLSSSIV